MAKRPVRFITKELRDSSEDFTPPVDKGILEVAMAAIGGGYRGSNTHLIRCLRYECVLNSGGTCYLGKKCDEHK